MPELTEIKIVNGCLQNDRVAQKALYDLYKTRMYTLAYRITNNFEDANDVLQEGFLQVFDKLHTYKGLSQLSTWIHSIMARTAIRKIKDRIFFEDIEKIDTSAHIDWGNHIDIDYLEKAISSLPDGYRSIFTLYEIEGFKHQEIAEMLDVSESTSKSQLFKAKRLLKEKLEEYVS
jgi:RNA polymerase sigma-70 factor (ECF subfamily)